MKRQLKKPTFVLENRPSSLLEDALARYSSTVDGVKHTLI